MSMIRSEEEGGGELLFTLQDGFRRLPNILTSLLPPCSSVSVAWVGLLFSPLPSQTRGILLDGYQKVRPDLLLSLPRRRCGYLQARSSEELTFEAYCSLFARTRRARLSSSSTEPRRRLPSSPANHALPFPPWRTRSRPPPLHLVFHRASCPRYGSRPRRSHASTYCGREQQPGGVQSARREVEG